MLKTLRLRLLLPLLILCSFGAVNSYADHISSADMYVDYIGTGPTDLRYRLTVVFYRICIANNLALDTISGGFKVASVKGNYSETFEVRNNGIEDTLDNLCPAFSAVNSCRVIANEKLSGYTRRVYTKEITLPSQQDDYLITWTTCCRLLSYTNINYAAGSGFYMELKLNNKTRYNNNTPRYQGIPFTFSCVNQPATLSNLPFDPDGDSLYTIRYDPHISVSNTVVYNPGYTSLLPTGTSTYYNVTPTTGRATFMAPAKDKYSLGFRTYDIDKFTGDTLSYITRDLTITVLECTNIPPTVDSLPQSVTGVRKVDTTGGEVVMTVCSQSELDFKINAQSNNPNGQIYMYPASKLPAGMTMTPTVTGGTGIAEIKWRPSAAQVGRYTVSLLGVDSTCAVGQEITLRREFTFTVIVRAALDAGPDLLICPAGDWPVQLGTNAPAENNRFTWTNTSGQPAEFLTCTDCAMPKARPNRDYYYVVSIDNPVFDCKMSDTVGVLIDTTVRITAPQDSLLVCRPSFIQLQSVVEGPNPRLNLPCGTTNVIACATADRDTATVGRGSTGPDFAVNTPFLSQQRFHRYQYIIPKRQLLDAGLYSGTLNSIGFRAIEPAIQGTTPLSLMTISLACIDQDTLPTRPDNASFISGTAVANITNYTLTANAWNDIPFSTPYNWDTTKNLLVDICMGPMTTLNANGADPVAMMPGQTIQKFSNTVNVCGGTVPQVQYYPQRPVTRFFYCPSPELPFLYSWKPGNFLRDSTTQNPLGFVSKSENLAVYTVGLNGCVVHDSLHIIVPEHKLNNGPQDTALCINQPVFLRASGGDDYQWFEYDKTTGAFSDASGSLSCTNCAEPVALPQDTTTYAVVFTNDVGRGNPLNAGNELGCPDTLYLTVNIWPLPNVYIANRDTTLLFGQSTQLYARGASRYFWTPGTALSNPNSPAPMVAPQETTNYIVNGIDSNGCSAKDTVTITLDYKINQLVPTGFTPNNDGRNDEFKIVNPSIYRLMEFRVFNRWGQEVFTTSDINQGWNGRWKGVDQQMGTYNYLIRVGTPDGQVYTHKGDVTLIR
jgi:gliding motility-associated-like protein